MEFATPLALLLAFLALPVAFLARRKPAGYVVPSIGPVSALRPTWKLRVARLLPALRVLAVVALAIAIAGPREGDADTVVPGEGVDISLALDISSSMDLAFSPGETRLQATREVVREFIKSRTDDRIGLVVFRDDALALSPPSLDYSALDSMVADLDSSLLPTDGTGIGVGLGAALNMLQDSVAASRVVILLTDGEQNADSISPERAADLAAALKIRIYTIGIVPALGQGTGRGIDEDLLKAIAERTDAAYFQASSPEQLEAVYQEIGSLERSRIGRESFESFTEWAPLFATFAAGLIALELVLRGTLLRRSPA
ncbi:MAG: VWA domain-containing protein [Dehalococcoidia bacterium]